MSVDLAGRVRQAALEHLASKLGNRVTCAKAEHTKETACRDVHDGHLCRWLPQNENHGRYKHACLCGAEWGEGVSGL